MARVLVHAAVEAWRGIVRNRAFGLQPTDPTTFTLASLVIVLAGLAGSVLPALRTGAFQRAGSRLRRAS